MGNHNCALAKFNKLWKQGINGFCPCHHTVIDAGQLFNPKWNRNFWIYKLRKTSSDDSVFHTNRTDFNNLICHCRKSGGFNIKDHVFSSKRLSLTVLYNSFQIIDQIGFHSINHFKIRIFWHNSAPLIKAVVCLRERLNNPVVGNCNRFVSPFVRLFDNLFCIGNPIHITHLGMTVKFHSFFRTGIHSRRSKWCNFLDSGNRRNRKLAVETVNVGDTF